jgi:Holliday junction DNA helicase RuvA
MIAYLKGRILFREPGRIILSTGNIGYNIFLDAKSQLSMKPDSEEQEFFISQIVRENEVTLYGFDSLFKLEIFEMLLSANKIGPKLALSFLSSLQPKDVITAVLSGDASSFGKIHGVGKKLLSQVILDCMVKAERIAEKHGIQSDSREELAVSEVQSKLANASFANTALKQLGFTGREIKLALDKVSEKRGAASMSDEQIISECLKLINS